MPGSRFETPWIAARHVDPRTTTIRTACRVHLFIQCPDLGLHGGPVRGYDHR
jgi:hypothetical protein